MQSKQDKPQNIDTLIHARWLLTPNAPDCLEDSGLAIHDGKIIDVDNSCTLNEKYQAKHTWQLDEHILLPGLINSHCHAAMTLLRGYADDLPLMSWLQEHIWPAEQQWVNSEFVQAGTRLAMAEMLLSGTTCFTDMYFYPDAVAKAAIDMGMRVQLAAPVMDFPTAWAKDAQAYIQKALQLWDDFNHHPLVQVGFGPHAPYSVADAPLTKIASLAQELDTFIQIHLHETAQEVQQSVQDYGMRPMARLKSLGFLSERVQAVHMTQLNETDYHTLATTGTHVIHCPESNLKLASGFCPVNTLQQQGVNVALGTDGAASNNDLDLLGEIKTAALLAKAVAQDAQALPAHQAINLACHNAAKALNTHHWQGALQAGFTADVVALNLASCHNQPLYNPISQVVYTHQAQDVSHVWVQGQCLVKAGQLTQHSLSDIIEQAQHWAKRIKH